MKKTERIMRIGLFACLLLLLLCVTGCKKDKDENVFPPELAAQLPQTTNYNVHKFVLDEDYDICSPIVRWNIDGNEYFMMVDTGAPDNCIMKVSAAKKILGKVLKKFEFADGFEAADDYGKFDMDLKVNFYTDKLEYIINPYYVSVFDEFYGDGLLGLTWMESYNNIVLDYVNHRIDYNQPPITDLDIPMTKDIYKWQYSIPFMLNGREVYGMIDTGNYGLTLSLGVIGFEKNENGLYVVHDMSIGDVHYENMEADDPDDGVKVANFFNTTNVLGYPCFKGHVIQLDFKNNIFRIK